MDFDLTEVVDRLIGNVYPTGDERKDSDAVDSIWYLVDLHEHLTDILIEIVNDYGTARERSIQSIYNHAYTRLKDTRDDLENVNLD